MSRDRFLLPVLLIALGPATFAQQPEDPKLEELLTPKELAEYQSDPDYKDRIDVFADAIKRYSDQLKTEVDAKKLDAIFETLRSVQALAHYALKEPLPEKGKGARSGEVRKLEIRIRKLEEGIKDAKTIAPYEYYPGFEAAVDDLHTLRAQLLRQMFGTAAKERDDRSETDPDSSSKPNPDVERLAQPAFGSGSFRYAQDQDDTRYSTEISGDQFTEAEYDKIRDNQDLVHRVNVLLAICESRLSEIQRRMKNEAWTDKEANPLEFFTFEQMVHAYDRALNSVMVNIDEKVKYKLATPKDVKKTLEKLNKKIEEFTPQLAPIKQLAEKNKDELLYREILQAEKDSDIARKGSLYGLGAPAQ